MNASETLLFSAADLLFSAPSSSVHCIHDAQPYIRPEPGTQAWFIGLTVVEGRLLPISDLALYFGHNACSGRIIEVAHQFGVAGLRVDEIHGVATSEPDPSYQAIDLGKLLQSPKFINIECATA